jgi:hypothetical protein
MPGGRPAGPRRYKTYTRDDVDVAKARGESDGRMLGRVSERTAIVDWLKWQSGNPRDLAARITRGDHVRST